MRIKRQHWNIGRLRFGMGGRRFNRHYWGRRDWNWRRGIAPGPVGVVLAREEKSKCTQRTGWFGEQGQP